jgi:hypothetical protein
MARRTLSTQGRIIAAGLSVAVGGALVGVMAAGDHTADASSTSSPTNPSSAVSPGAGGGTTATPADGSGFDDDSTGNPGFQPQPQTRTGGS